MNRDLLKVVCVAMLAHEISIVEGARLLGLSPDEARPLIKQWLIENNMSGILYRQIHVDLPQFNWGPDE